MEAQYNVIVSKRAEADRFEIDDYIFADSPQNALKIADEFDAAIDSLQFFPYRFRVFESNADPAKVVRSMPIPPFKLFYRVVESALCVEVISIRHGARDYPDRFFR